MERCISGFWRGLSQTEKNLSLHICASCQVADSLGQTIEGERLRIFWGKKRKFEVRRNVKISFEFADLLRNSKKIFFTLQLRI